MPITARRVNVPDATLTPGPQGMLVGAFPDLTVVPAELPLATFQMAQGMNKAPGFQVRELSVSGTLIAKQDADGTVQWLVTVVFYDMGTGGYWLWRTYEIEGMPTYDASLDREIQAAIRPFLQRGDLGG